jgi:hypothetical protein
LQRKLAKTTKSMRIESRKTGAQLHVIDDNGRNVVAL